MRAAVVGHVEWIDFIRVEEVPRPGEIVHASEAWSEAAGGGAVAAVQLAEPRLRDELLHGARRRRPRPPRARRARGEGASAPRLVGRRAAAPRRHVRRRLRRAHDHRHRRQAPAARRRRLASVGGAAANRVRLLHRRRRRVALEGASRARRRRDRPRAADARALGRRARRARRQRHRRRRALRARRPRPAAAPVRRDVGPARRLGAAGRPVRSGRAAGADRGHLRRRRLLRGGPDVRARPWRRAARRARARCEVRRHGRSPAAARTAAS